MALTVLVCYDISADATRARVAAYLQQWGDWIQRSVFVCAISPEDLDEVNCKLASMIDPNTDAVHLLPACGTCWSRLTIHGQADRQPDIPYWAVL